MTRKAVFIHIPKTAGTTLVRTMERNYPPEACVSLYNPETYARDIPGALAKPATQLVFGHFLYDEKWLTDADYIFTFLRDPIHRVVSNYLHVKRSTTPIHQEWMRDIKNIYDFLKHRQSFNMMTRRLGGFGEMAPFEKDLSGALELALNHLNKMNLVGITEHYNTSLMLLAKDLGWKKLKQENHNVATNRDEFNALLNEAHDAIAERNKLDLEVYALGLKLFEKRTHEIRPFTRLKTAYYKMR